MSNSFKITEKKDSKTLIYEILPEYDKKERTDRTDSVSYEFRRIPRQVISEDDNFRVCKYTLSKGNINIIIITIWDDKCAINGGVVRDGKLEISAKSKGIRYEKVNVKGDAEYFKYEPSEDRRILIIDLESGEEVEKETVTNESKEYTMCKIFPNKKYLVIEFRFGESKIIVIGMCTFGKENGKYIANIDERESKRIDYEFFLENISKSLSKEIYLEKDFERSKEGL